MAKAARFGDFALLDDLGESEVADRFRAMHDAQGGPFFVKAYRRLPAPFASDLQLRAERLIAVRDARLVAHLGHGLVEGVPFTVSPWIEGFDIEELGRSLRERRVTLPIDTLLAILREVALAVDALHTQTRDATGGPMPHGEVTPRHVRVTAQGGVLITGLATPRGPQPGAVVDVGLDAAGIGATVYDLIAMTRPGGVRMALPQPLERLVRRALGIGPQTTRLTAHEIAEAVLDVADAMRVDIANASLPELAARTMKALGKRGRSLSTTGAADQLPVLEPIGDRAEHELAALPKSRGAPDLVPLDIPQVVPRAPERQREPSRPMPVASKPVPAEISTKMPPSTAVPRSALVEVPPALRSPPKTPPPASIAPQAPAARPPPTPPVAAPLVAAAPPVAGPAGAGPAPTFAPPPKTPVPDRPVAGHSPVAEPARPMKSAAPAPITALTSIPPDLQGLGPISNDEELWASNDPPYAKDVGSPLQEPTIEGPFELFSTGDRTTPEITSLRAGDERLGLRDLADPTRQETLPAASTVLDQRTANAAAFSFDDPTGQSREPRLADLPPDEKTRDGPPIASVTASELSSEPVSDNAPLMPADAAVRALLERGSVTRSAAQRALDQQRHRGGRLLDILVGDGVITDADLADALADEAVKPRISDEALQRRLPPPELIQRLPQSFATERRVLPLRLDASVLVLAVVDPFDEPVSSEVARIFGAKSVHVHVATRAAMTRAVAVAYRRGADAAVTSALILLCTDDDDQAGRVGARLVNEGFRVELVATVALARRMLALHPLDACLVKDTLSDGTGTDFLIDARADKRSADLPIFLFGADDATLEARALDLGGDDYFAAPLNMDVVVRKLRRALAKRPAKKPEPTIADVASSVLSPFGEGAVPGDFDGAAGGGDFGAVIDDAPAEPTGVMGTLKQMSVAEIVQSLELGRKTARVELVPNDGPKGSFAFDGGQIVFATRDDGLDGEKAFYALCKHQEGFFRIHYGDQGPRRNIDKPTTFLLLEAMRLMDEDGRPPGSM